MVQTKGMDPEVGESMGYLKNSKLGGCEASTGAMTVVWADVMAMAVERKGQTQVHFRDKYTNNYDKAKCGQCHTRETVKMLEEFR